MDFYDTKSNLYEVLRSELGEAKLRRITSELERQISIDPFDTAALTNLGMAKIISMEWTSGFSYSKKAERVLPKDITWGEDANQLDVFFIDNRRERLLNNDIRFQAYYNQLEASILCYHASEGLHLTQERHSQRVQEAAQKLNTILPTVTNVGDLKNAYKRVEEFFSYLFSESSDTNYGLARMDARASVKDSIKVARKIDPRFPKIKPEIIN